MVVLFAALPGAGGEGDGAVDIPGLGGMGRPLPDRIGSLVHPKAAVGFTVDTEATLLSGAGWGAGVLLIARLASRRASLPPGWSAVHRVTRPAVSARHRAAGGRGSGARGGGVHRDRRRLSGRIAGAALPGTPIGIWPGLPLGLFVAWNGHATGALTRFLPHPLDQSLGARSDRPPVTLSRLAELDGRAWLRAVAAASAMLLTGVLRVVCTPVVRLADDAVGLRPSDRVLGLGPPDSAFGPRPSDRALGLRPPDSALGPAPRCTVRLGVATAVALPLPAHLTDVSVTASLPVLGFDAFGSGLELHGRLGTSLLIGAAWGVVRGRSVQWPHGRAGRRGAGGVGAAGCGGGAGRRGRPGAMRRCSDIARTPAWARAGARSTGAGRGPPPAAAPRSGAPPAPGSGTPGALDTGRTRAVRAEYAVPAAEPGRESLSPDPGGPPGAEGPARGTAGR
nr:streptophobe family protein [Streptomyces roseochromogenus]